MRSGVNITQGQHDSCADGEGTYEQQNHKRRCVPSHALVPGQIDKVEKETDEQEMKGEASSKSSASATLP